MRKKLVLIQFSRALVPVLVMLFHVSENMKGYWEYNLFGFSYLPVSGGVNYFFALSGFMLYYIYRNSLGQPNQLKEFLLNRFVRIYPLYWILTIIAIPVFILYPFLGSGAKLTPGFIFQSFLLSPTPNDNGPVLDVAWSLTHTVYFYFIFSILFLSKHSKWVIACWAALSLAAVYGIGLGGDNYVSYFLFDQYNLIFLSGILCAYFITNYKFNVKLSAVAAVIGFLGFPLTWLNYIHKWITIDFDISTGLASILIIFGLASIDSHKDIKIPRLLNYLGNASFAIYLSHNLALNALCELFNKFNLYDRLGGELTSMILLLLITCAGCFVHSFIEKPTVSKLKKVILKNPSPVKKVNNIEASSGAGIS